MTKTTAVSKQLLNLVARFPKVRVLVVGDLVADHYVYGQTERISREAPVPIVRHEREEVKLGGAANAAHNARTLGGVVTVVGALGKDAMGRELSRQLTAAGISVKAVISPAIATETKTRVLAGGQSTTRQQLLRIDRGATGSLPASVQRQLARTLIETLSKADVCMVSDYGAGVIDDATRLAVLGWARRGGLLCVDSRFALRQFIGATVCKPNEPELAALTGRPLLTEGDLIAAGLSALQMLDCQSLLVTRGRLGMAVFTRGESATFIPVHGQHDAVDVTGAGDTVNAAFALGLGAGAKAAVAARLANVAGALKVQKSGTATVSADELRAELGRLK